ncbi:MAG TPA: DUF2179 domain-containing protein [Anaerolineales bacterium]|nr:DUF2179 domain-containing protein [Anaerolineales bacterium]
MQELLLTLPAWGFAFTIFFLRVVDMSIGTLRIMVSMRGNKLLTWILGFFQSVIFVLAITSVISSLDNVLNIIAYAAGYATGGVVGMWLEQKLALGFTHVQITSSRRGAALAEKLREEGFAVTEISARGKDGMVSMLSCNVRRKRAPLVEKIAREADEDAFITSEDVRPVRRGFWRA